MKKFKMTLLTLVAMFCLVFGMAFAVACGGDEGGNEGDTEYYTLTLTYEKSQGTVTASASASDKGYVKDEAVTLTVTPAENYEVDSVKIGDEGLNAGTDGKYSFKIGGNTTVTVTFKETEKGPSENALLLDAKYYGTYHDMAETDKSPDLVIGENGVFWGEDEVLLASPFEEGDTSYSVTVDGNNYFLYVHDNGQVDLLDAASEGPSFLKEGVTLGYTVTVNKLGEGTATLSPEKEKYDQGEQVTLTVSPAEDWFLRDVVINGETVSLEENAYTFSVTMDLTIAVTFLAEGQIPAEFQGAWKNLEDSADTFTLTADSITWAGHEVTLESIAVYADFFDPTPLGTQLTVTIDGDSDNTITLLYGANAVEIMWMGTEGYEDHYYVLGDGLALDSGALAPGAFSEVGGTGKLSVSDAGVLTIDGTAVKLYSTGNEYLFFNEAVYTLEIRNDNYVIVSNPADYLDSTNYIRDAISAAPHALLVGEWTEESGGKLVVNADGSTTLTGVDILTAIKFIYSDMKGATVLLTTSSGTTVESLSLNFNEGEWSFGFYLDEGMVSFSKAGEKVVLGEDWQSGYEYDGTDEYVDPTDRFIVNENGIALVNDFNAPIESSYFYGVKVSDTEYAVWINYSIYTLTLNLDQTISISDGENVLTYKPCEIVPQDVFSVTLQYDSDQGYVTLVDETPDGDWGDVYTFVKPAAGTTYPITILVTTQPGYKVKSVMIGDAVLTDENGNGRYSYSADGSANITVVITFEEAALEQLTISDTTLYGTYSGVDSMSESPVTKTLTIDASGVTFNGEIVYLVEKSSETMFLVKIGAMTYMLNIDASQGSISLSESLFTEDYYLTKDGGSTTTSLSVTISYGDDNYTEAMGTAAADKESYSDGDTVKITITPGSGYSVGLVTANGETLTVGDDGSYTFVIHVDTTVTVTFVADSPAA